MTDPVIPVWKLITLRRSLMREIRDLDIEMTSKSIDSLRLRKELLENHEELFRMTNKMIALHEQLEKVLDSINGNEDLKNSKKAETA